MTATAPNLYKIEINSVDVTDYTYNLDFKKYKTQPVKTGTIRLKRNVTDVLPMIGTIIGKSITIQRGFLSSTERYIFRGEIVSFKLKGSIYELSIACKMYAATKRNFDYSYDYNIDPSAGVGSEIVKNLLDQIGLTYTTDSIPTTGVDSSLIIKKFLSRDNILVALQDLSKIYKRIIFYNDEDDLVYFIPNNYIATSTILETGTNIINRVMWNITAEDMANNITLIGGLQLDWNTELFTGDGATYEWTLAAIPVDTEVYVNNILQQRGVDSSDPKDFVIDSDSKKITFTSIPGLGIGIEVNYSYNVPVKVKSSNDVSIDTYTQRDLTVIDTKLTNTDDAELQITNLLEQKSETLVSAPIRVIGNNDLAPGQIVNIIDNLNSINKNVGIVSVEYFYPYTADKVDIGAIPATELDIQLNILNAIQKIERELASNSDINVQIMSTTSTVEVVGYTIIETATMEADVLYWDSDTQGTWDDFDWGDGLEETYTVVETIYINSEVVI